MDNMAQVQITQVRSIISRPENQRRTLRALGLRKLHQTVTHELTPSIKGMINQVSHLIKVENI